MKYPWTVGFTSKAEKQARKLASRERGHLVNLVNDLQIGGPVQPEWPNYSKLSGGNYHCHLSHKWSACWRVENNTVRLIEIYYVGSRENAPY